MFIPTSLWVSWGFMALSIASLVSLMVLSDPICEIGVFHTSSGVVHSKQVKIDTDPEPVQEDTKRNPEPDQKQAEKKDTAKEPEPEKETKLEPQPVTNEIVFPELNHNPSKPLHCPFEVGDWDGYICWCREDDDAGGARTGRCSCRFYTVLHDGACRDREWVLSKRKLESRK